MTRRHMLPIIAVTITVMGLGLTSCTSGTTGTTSSTSGASTTLTASASTAPSTATPLSSATTESATATPGGGLAAKITWFDAKKYSLTQDGSLWQIVNKAHPFQNRHFVPDHLVVTATTNGKQFRADAAAALATMRQAARAAGAPFVVVSAYRSFTYQTGLYNRYKAQHGKAAADRFSARPGYSEHQTGLATDLGSPDNQCTLQNCFGNTKAGKWVTKNSWKYGFILRYTKGGEATTGYMHEAWHFRYLGKDAAKAYHESGATTLEQFFGVSGGTTYRE